MTLDPRLHAVRPDLADRRLRSDVVAESYCDGQARQVVTGLADLRRQPSAEAPLDAQIWYGEAVTLFEESAGWAWVQAERDGYVGYTPLSSLGDALAPTPTHWITAPMSLRFPAADIKALPLDRLPMGSLLRAVDSKDSFLELHDGSFVFARHAAPPDEIEEDWPETALRFLGVPYLWGGRSMMGIDCSGLVQTALILSGRRVLRDSDMLRDLAELGQDLPPDSPRRRGDLLFSPGHVVMAVNGEEIVHANAHHLAVVREAFATFAQRIAARGESVSHLRRPH